MSKFNTIFLPIAFTVLIIGTGIYFYNKNKTNASAQNTSNGGVGMIAGVSNSINASTITNYNEYMVKVLDVRSPINKKIEDILSKSKYKTLFDKNTMISETNDIKKMINDGIVTFNNLSLSAELTALEQKQVESLSLLNEAMDAYIAFQNATDQTEQQKQSELMSYKIDQSNALIQNNSSNNQNSTSGTNNSNNSTMNIVQ